MYTKENRNMKLAGIAAILSVVAGVGSAEKLEFAACLSKSEIPLGTYAQLTVYVKNNSSEDVVVDSLKTTVPVRYTPWLEQRPVTSVLPLGPTTVKPGEIRFWTQSVPGDSGFSSLLLGDYTASVSFVVKVGDSTADVNRDLHYRIVEPSEEMALMRQRYTKEVEACDRLDGQKQVIVHRLDAVGAAADARTEFEQSFGARSQAAAPDSIDAERLAASFAHPAHRAATAFRHYIGSAPGDTFDYDGALRTLDWHLRQTVWHLTGPLTEGELSAKERSILDGGDPFAIFRAVYIYSREGADKALAYLRTLDAQSFNCADRAFYDEFVERITWKIGEEGRPDKPRTPSQAKPNRYLIE